MSLHTLANHLQSAGRGEDKVLVHMTPGEVSGLQSLAMAHGGSLTINPETGLPEAGFLKSLLPMVAGFALGPAGFGLMTSMQAGLTVGALTGVASGSLKKGIMAGLGAYGGAGLGEGLMAQGAGVPTTAPPTANTPTMNVGTTGVEGMKQNLYGPGKGIFSTTPSAAPNAMTGFSSTAPAVTPYTSANLPTAIQGGNVFPSVGQTSDLLGKTVSPNLPGQPLYTPDPGAMNVANRIYQPGSVGSFGSVPNAGYVPTGPGGLPQAAPYSGTVRTTGTVGPYEPVGTKLDLTAMQRNAAAGTPRTLSTAATVSPTDVVMPRSGLDQLSAGVKESFSGIDGLKGLYNAMPTGSVAASGLTLMEAMKPEAAESKKGKSLIRPYDFDYGATNVASEPYTGSAEQLHFNPTFTARTPYEAPGPEYAAEGGLMGYAVGGPVEQMSALNSIGANTGYPMASVNTPVYSNPMMQRPEAVNVIAPSVDAGVGAYSGEPRFKVGGLSSLGDYSDGGRLLKGPGDGVSDSIPASIGNRQPARLADGEFVVPARIVSEIGNGSTEAGARKLYAMMDRVQKARRKTVGKGKVAVNSKAENLLPA